MGSGSGKGWAGRVGVEGMQRGRGSGREGVGKGGSGEGGSGEDGDGEGVLEWRGWGRRE